MGEFFKPMRRKFGVTTLVMALVFWFVGSGVRSLYEIGKAFTGHYRSSGHSESKWWGSYTWEYSSEIELVLPTGIEGMLVVLLIHYWFIVIPLILLSAYLLMSKPLSSNQRKLAVPIRVEGA